MTTTYREFLEAKTALSESKGFACEPSEVSPACMPHQRDIVAWGVRGGCRAYFADFGLGKTRMQIETVRLVLAKCGEASANGLIVIPLGMRAEFIQEAAALNVAVKFIRSIDEATGADIYLTNYETVREGKLDPRAFVVVSLDEAAVLRSFGSKTFGEMLFGPMAGVPYRFVATATPSPNEYLELIAYAHFLGVMDMGEAKTRFFKRNSEHADKLTIHPHKEEEFWLWVSSWAVFVSKPSDLGYSDEGYELPDLDIRWHEIPVDHLDGPARTTKRGQAHMLKDASFGVSDAAREKRDSLPARLAKLVELRNEEPLEHRIVWHDLEDERHALEKLGIATVYGTQDLDEREDIVGRFSRGRLHELAAKPVMLGSGVNLQRHCSRAVFLGIGHKFNDFIQAIHRLRRYGQSERVRIDIIYTESERSVRANLERKWAQHDEARRRMAEIIRQYGLAESARSEALKRSIGVARVQESGDRWTLVNNDCVEELASMATDSVGLIVTSIPFSSQYEYTPSYNDW